MGIVLLTLREALLSPHYIILFLEVYLSVQINSIPVYSNKDSHVLAFSLPHLDLFIA